jgi:methoxymalonate biosynthesis acyl carrier protein
MEDPQALARRIAKLFTDRLHTEVPSADTDLFETGILDSLRFVELLAALEEAFGVHITVEELEIDDFRSVSRIADFLAVKQVR